MNPKCQQKSMLIENSEKQPTECLNEVRIRDRDTGHGEAIGSNEAERLIRCPIFVKAIDGNSQIIDEIDEDGNACITEQKICHCAMGLMGSDDQNDDQSGEQSYDG